MAGATPCTHLIDVNPIDLRATIQPCVDGIVKVIGKQKKRVDIYFANEPPDTGINALNQHMIYYELISDNIFVKDFYLQMVVTAPDNASAADKQAAFDSWTSKLSSYSYVYLYKVDTSFEDQYASLFPGGKSVIEDKTLYAVEHNGSNIELVKAK